MVKPAGLEGLSLGGPLQPVGSSCDQRTGDLWGVQEGLYGCVSKWLDSRTIADYLPQRNPSWSSVASGFKLLRRPPRICRPRRRGSSQPHRSRIL